jgi:hypothetical protein
VLVGGRYAADWRVERAGDGQLRLRVDPFVALPASDRDALDAEGERLRAFLGRP